MDRNYHMKSAIANRPAAVPGPVIRSKGPRSGSFRQSSGGMGLSALNRSNSQRGSMNDHFIKQNINSVKNKLPPGKQKHSQQVDFSHQNESDFLLNRIQERKVETNATNLNSAALQDHFMKNLKLGNIDPFKKKMVGAPRPPRQNINRPAQSSHGG